MNEIGEARAAFAVGARRRMEMIEDQVALFGDGEEILPGIAAVATYGHTPGHMSFEVRQGSDAAMILGDAIANHHVAFARPEWPGGADQDGEMAVATRAMLFDRVVSEMIQIVGFHLPAGGIGRVERGPCRRLSVLAGAGVMRWVVGLLFVASSALASEDIPDQYPGSALYQKPVEVIPHVFSAIGATAPPTYENTGHNNNLSFIVTGDGVVVVNGGAAYVLAEALHDEIRTITDQSVKLVINENGQGPAMLGNSYWGGSRRAHPRPCGCR